jgi:stearoyl-CoA desaturase (delta-9 desaturase)
VFGFWSVLLGGAGLYVKASADADMVAQLGKGTPDDWIERALYTPYHKLGITLLLVAETYLFAGWGILMWLIQMAWIPFWAAGVVNGIGHFWGYKNGPTRDHSRNIVPWGIIIGGEELHNNHHLNPAGAKLSLRPWEFDAGWMYIKLLEFLKLAQIKTI